MHGNPHALMADDRNLKRAPTDTRLTLWLGLPEARAHFDPSTLSASDHARIAEHRSGRRRADFEVSRALLALANVGNAPYSLSHSAEHAALLIAPSGLRIGVDLEINRSRDVLRLARFAFDEREVQAIESAPGEARHALFYTLWTLKESFAKALQLDLVDALRQCVFWKANDGWHAHVPTREAWSAAVFQPRPDIFLGAACVGNESMRADQWEWPPQRRADWPLIAACAGVPSTAAVAPA